jgi:hypothetical protein
MVKSREEPTHANGPGFNTHFHTENMRGSVPKSAKGYTIYFTDYTELERRVAIVLPLTTLSRMFLEPCVPLERGFNVPVTAERGPLLHVTRRDAGLFLDLRLMGDL